MATIVLRMTQFYFVCKDKMMRVHVVNGSSSFFERFAAKNKKKKIEQIANKRTLVQKQKIRKCTADGSNNYK